MKSIKCIKTETYHFILTHKGSPIGGILCNLLCSVTKQYNLIPNNVQWCSAAGKVTAGLAESNSSLPPGLWLRSPAGWLPRTGISSGILCSFRVWDYLTIIICVAMYRCLLATEWQLVQIIHRIISDIVLIRLRYWPQRADERHGNLPQGNQELLVVEARFDYRRKGAVVRWWMIETLLMHL